MRWNESLFCVCLFSKTLSLLIILGLGLIAATWVIELLVLDVNSFWEPVLSVCRRLNVLSNHKPFGFKENQGLVNVDFEDISPFESVVLLCREILRI